MLALEEEEEALFILELMFCCWLPEEEGVRRVGIMVWKVRRVQVAPAVWGKNRHKLEMEVQMSSQVNATEGTRYHGGVGAGWFGQGCIRLGSSHGERGGSRAQICNRDASCPVV